MKHNNNDQNTDPNIFLTIPWHQPFLNDNEMEHLSNSQHHTPQASWEKLDQNKAFAITQTGNTCTLPSTIELLAQNTERSQEAETCGKKRPLKTVISTDNENTYSKWRKLTLVAQSIQKFRSLNVERICSESTLRETVNNIPNTEREGKNNEGIMYITPNEIHSGALKSFRDNNAFFEALEVAGKRELAIIKNILTNDPKENFYDPESPQRLVNRPDHRGYTPLYVACKNGNLELVKLLIDYKANPYQLCQISPKQRESVLKVASRWGHFQVVKYLLGDQFSWSEKELKVAYEGAGNTIVKTLLKEQLEKTRRPFLKRLFNCH